jgi:UDP-glucose 4-epimerase
MKNKTVLVTGSQGFVGSFLSQNLLGKGYKVVGIDNFSKYNRVDRPQDVHDNFTLIEHDLIEPLESYHYADVDYVIACAAMIGGITFFSKWSYDLTATNDRITANTFDLAIDLYKNYHLSRIVVLSSSMVFENTTLYPTPEDEVEFCRPPSSNYGFNKLNCEYYAKGANEQYGLPYTIVRPFNCVGIGEDVAVRDVEITHGTIKLLSSHVLPDLINKAFQLDPHDPLPILGKGNQVRHYTNGKDVARGIIMAMESADAVGEDFNISSSQATTVRELATEVWKQIHGCEPKFTHETPLHYDVQMRSPCVAKAKNILGFEAEISLEQSVAEVIEYMRIS